MMIYKSIFKDELNDYIRYKRNLGYDFNHLTVLNQFDKFLVENKIIIKEISKETFEKWVSFNKNKVKKYCFIKQFAKYLLINNYQNIYYTDEYKIKYNRFIPYIFDEDEIKSLFETLDCWKIKTRSKNDKLIIPVMFKLVYSCGLRISEALNLRYKDLDLDNGLITIRDSKNHKSRILPLSDSMKKILNAYVNKKNLQSYLFEDSNGKAYSYLKIYKIWHKILILSNIKKTNKQQRIHDLRHTFAIRSLERLEKLGFDLYTSLPLLSKYMGHSTIRETEYYLKLCESNFKHVINLSNNYCGNIFPKLGAIDEE